MAKTKVFRVHRITFKETLNIAIIAEFSFKAARLGAHGQKTDSFDGHEPIIFSYAESEETRFKLWNSRVTFKSIICAGEAGTFAQVPVKKAASK